MTKKIQNKLACIFTALCVFFLSFTGCSEKRKEPVFVLKELPYAENALEPHISADTMKLHYGKHHAGYVKKANKLIQESDIKGMTPEEIILASAEELDKYSAIFNNAAQAWNHQFFWESMKPSGGTEPAGEISKKLRKTFGSYHEFKELFSARANSFFGSGWIWLVMEEGKLKITTTGNADTPLAYGQTPLFTIDVWEHAYYLDYQNRRADYVKNILENFIDWDRVSKRMVTE